MFYEMSEPPPSTFSNCTTIGQGSIIQFLVSQVIKAGELSTVWQLS
jgi:hypothetical protein